MCNIESLLHIRMGPMYSQPMGENMKNLGTDWAAGARSSDLRAVTCFMQQIHWCKWLLLLIERNTWQISTFSPYDSIHFASIFKYSFVSLNYKLNSLAAMHHLQFPWLIIRAMISLLLLLLSSTNIGFFLQPNRRRN